MSDLQNILNEEYNKKSKSVNFKSLVQMIEEILEIPIPQLTTISEEAQKDLFAND